MNATTFQRCTHCNRPKPANQEPLCPRCKTASIRNRNGAHIQQNNVTRYRVIRKEQQP